MKQPKRIPHVGVLLIFSVLFRFQFIALMQTILVGRVLTLPKPDGTKMFRFIWKRNAIR